MNRHTHHEGAASGSSVLINRLCKELLKTGTFLIAASIVIVFGTIAWFVGSNQVQASTSDISAQHDLLRLATMGPYRQTPEESYLQLPNDNDTTKIVYDGNEYYYTEGGTIALRLDSQVSVFPGAKGTVTFYLIPKRSGSLRATLFLELAGYQESTENGLTIAKRIENDVLNALLSGHILLFGKMNPDGSYSERLWSEDAQTHVLHVDQNAVADVPIPVTFYWVWPLRYENMKNDVSFDPDFTDWLKTQETSLTGSINGSNYWYNSIFLAESGTDLKNPLQADDAYNQADEYIGHNSNYLYLSIQTSSANAVSG